MSVSETDGRFSGIQSLWKRIAGWLFSDRSRRLIVCLGLLGMSLILISEILPRSDTQTEPQPEESEYSLEQKLSELLSEMEGVGKTEVLITYQHSGVTEYAQELKENSDGDERKTERSYVLVGSASSQSGLVVSVQNPAVSGVVVICEGGDSSVVRERVVNAVSVACGIGAAHIYVAAMQPEF